MRCLPTLPIVALFPILASPNAPAAEEVKASHILVRTQDEADVIRNEIVEKGGDRKAFMEAARKHSKDVTSKRAGGALGWFTRQKMVREFSDEAFNLKLGEISHPVKSQYGWHLILVEDRRDLQVPSQEAPAPRVDPAALAPKVPGKAAAPPGQTPAPVPAQKPPADVPLVSIPGGDAIYEKDLRTPAAKVQFQKPTLPPKALKLTVEIKERFRRPDQTVEVDLTLANSGEEAQKVLAPEFLPLGFTVTSEASPTPSPANWEELKAKKPQVPIMTLGSRKVTGGTFTLNDSFKDLPPSGRYRLAWAPQVFFQNLEATFPDIALLPDYAAIKATYNDSKIFRREAAALPGRQRPPSFQAEVVFSILDPIMGASGKKYYASIDLERQPQTIWVELYADRQPSGVQQFARLALEGFYDGLSFFDIQKGSYLRGGCPRNSGTGAPEQPAYAHNAQQIPHEKGTISLVTRTTRTGTREAREVGSIFFVCRKPHPEWDTEHVPIGKIISGEEVLDLAEASGQIRIRKIGVVTSDQAPPEVTGVSPPPTTGPEGKAVAAAPGRALPVAKLKTQRGELTVELHEDDAPNTVANFIELTERGFFNPDLQTKKEMTFYYAVPGMVLITGSPTNNPEEVPPHRIPSETPDNKRSHEKGTLTMLLEKDPQSGNPVPDSAGTQFMICLQELPAWNGLYTPFGKVTAGLEILDQLTQGDKIESVAILQKRSTRPYKARTVPQR